LVWVLVQGMIARGFAGDATANNDRRFRVGVGVGVGAAGASG